MSEDLFRFTSGPRNARILLVGEAWGESEARSARPFCGYSGHELDRMLAEAGLDRSTILCTNVISEHPPFNDFTHFLVPIKEAKHVKPYHGFFPRPALASSIDRLWRLIATVNPDLIVTAGNWPFHVLTSCTSTSTSAGHKLPTGITTWRGSQTWCRNEELERARATIGSSTKGSIPVLPVIHPAAITRQWYLRSVTVHDLRSRAMRFTKGLLDWNEPALLATARPSFSEVMRDLNHWIARASHAPFRLSVDIETYARSFITCIGLGDETYRLCIPFFYFDNEGVNIPFWTIEEELAIWLRLKHLLELPLLEIVGQNFMYDTIFLARYGIRAIAKHDTQVMHHLLYPGTPKALHYISSLYCNYYCYWKDESEEWAAGTLSASDLWSYNNKDIAYTLECCETLLGLIKLRKYEDHLSWRMREWQLARKMALRGIRDDTALRAKYRLDLMHQATALQDYLITTVPECWRWGGKGVPWFNSPKATMDMLYEGIGIPPIAHKKTKRPTVDDAALEALIANKKHRWLEPLLSRLQALRSLNVFRSHFIDIKLGPAGRLYTQFTINHPETFRWASSANPFDEGTNTQNFPKVSIDD